MKRWLAISLCAALLLAALVGCGENGAGSQPDGTTEGERRDLSVRCTGPVTELDPARAAANNTETVAYHLFENLLRWEDDGTGHAVLALGMASDYVVEQNVDGSTTYTFTIRSDAQWSDGEAVTASDFVYGWQRLFSMEEPPATIHQLYMVEGFDQAWANRDGTFLTGVSAPDEHTLVLEITDQCAYFLEAFCAGTLTMPVRQDIVEQYGAGWANDPDTLVTNGPYHLAQRMMEDDIFLAKSETYYNAAQVWADSLAFTWNDDAAISYQNLQDGALDFLAGLPEEEIAARAEAGTLTVEPEPSTYALLLNNLSAPFDNETVRQAFAACIDTAELTAAVGDATLTAATGFVPHGIADRSSQQQEAPQEAEDLSLPQDLLSGDGTPETAEIQDFRSVGDADLPEEETTPEARAARAQSLLSQAGYPGGQDFPEVTYLYEDTPENQAAAEYLSGVWQETLHVTVTLQPVTEADLRTQLLEGAFTMAAFRFDAAYNDATAFLSRWQSDAGAIGGNLVGFSDRAYDLLLYVVPETASNAGREACLHDAEQILLESCGVVPLFYYGRTAQLADGLSGLYGLSDGTYFFRNVGPESGGNM